mgnify:CR=1 FL=1
MELPQIFEAVMLVCFGCSWPIMNCNTLRVKRVEGQSIHFMWLVFTGYVSGALFNMTRPDGWTWVLFLYLFNLAMVATGISLYYLYRRPVPPTSPETE